MSALHCTMAHGPAARSTQRAQRVRTGEATGGPPCNPPTQWCGFRRNVDTKLTLARRR